MNHVETITNKFLDKIEDLDIDKEIAFEYIIDIIGKRAEREKEESQELSSSELQDLIIVILENDRDLTASKIHDKLKRSFPHLELSDINSALYKMRGKKTYYSGRPRVWNIFETVRYENDVLDYLDEGKVIYQILDYVRNTLGYSKAQKKNINALLYRFLKEGKVAQTEDSQWVRR